MSRKRWHTNEQNPASFFNSTLHQPIAKDNPGYQADELSKLIEG
ncbi:MAG TPA: hypothetical protein V6D10_18960 [Trichocoleus sp.]|jgi:hypothetical protein